MFYPFKKEIGLFKELVKLIGIIKNSFFLVKSEAHDINFFRFFFLLFFIFFGSFFLIFRGFFLWGLFFGLNYGGVVDISPDFFDLSNSTGSFVPYFNRTILFLIFLFILFFQIFNSFLVLIFFIGIRSLGNLGSPSFSF